MMKALLFTLVLGFGGLLSVMVGTRGVVGALPAVDLPERLQPGQPLPHDAYCYWEHWSSSFLYCQADGVYLTFDQETRTIQRATKNVRDLTIGDLILVWGEPTGQTRYGYSADIYWGSRSAFVSSTHGFSPFSTVYFVTYRAELEQAGLWRGFVN